MASSSKVVIKKKAEPPKKRELTKSNLFEKIKPSDSKLDSTNIANKNLAKAQRYKNAAHGNLVDRDKLPAKDTSIKNVGNSGSGTGYGRYINYPAQQKHEVDSVLADRDKRMQIKKKK